ncbi:MAG: hypothetical protein LBM70_03305 [Victivallales bacterium]|jgi:catechol-2,3-dioxygenase|nr:hypothetical protein [Victivallales bacterium]
MNAKRFGLVLKVNDLDNCRMFYRDLLELGEPLFDSTFAVIFALSKNLTLTLEKSAAQYLEHASCAASIAIAVPDLESFVRKMEDSDYPLKTDSVRIGIIEYRRGIDPEGNPFLVYQDLT